MSLADSIATFATGIYTVTRRQSNGTIDGKRVPPTITTFPIQASVVPESSLSSHHNLADLRRSHFGQRTDIQLAVFSAVELINLGDGFEPDTISIYGKDWEVEDVVFWALAGTWVATVHKVGD